MSLLKDLNSLCDLLLEKKKSRKKKRAKTDVVKFGYVPAYFHYHDDYNDDSDSGDSSD